MGRVAGMAIFVCATALAAQDAASVWGTLQKTAFDPDRSARVSNLVLARDRIRITLADGAIQFSQPVENVVFGAAFAGHGRIQVAPPNDTEAYHLRLLAGQDSLDMNFTEAVFSFADNTLDEVASQVGWANSSDTRLARLYQDRQQAREDVGAELLPRLFKSVLSSDRKRTALFAADLKTNEKGWIHVRFDALDPEEVTAGRWTNWGITTHFDTWLSFPAGDRKPAEAFRDPLAKEDSHIRGYRINAGVTGGAELRATTQVTLEHRAAGERVLLFELDSNLRVESVKDGQGASLPFFQPRETKDRNQSYGDYVAVVLPEATRSGQSQTLEFRYAGKRVIRKMGSGNYFCQSYGWYPSRPNSFAARADFEMVFRSPKSYTLVATGNKVSETTDGDLRVTTWKSDLPLSVAGFAFGDYKVHIEKAGSVDVEIYANREGDYLMQGIEASDHLPGQSRADSPALGSLSPAGLAKTMGIEIANTLRLFEIYFGPYPYKRLAVTNIPFSYGQGWPMLLYLSALSFLDNTQRQGLGLTHHTEITDFFRAHEASHQWWGHRVSWKSYHDQWLSEGFAQFSGNLYVQYRKSEKEYLTRLRQDKQELLTRDQHNRVYESLGPVWLGTRISSSESPRAYSMVIYNKGGFILHMLRMMLFDPRGQKPEERFMAMMQDFCRTYHNKPASTEDFKEIAEKYMLPAMDLDNNGRLDWFFRQYVYGTGVPQYRFRYAAQDAGGGKWKVTGSITQSGVPSGWKDILRLYTQYSGRTTPLGWISVSQAETPFEFLLPMKPEKLSLNDKEDLLAEIKQ